MDTINRHISTREMLDYVLHYKTSDFVNSLDDWYAEHGKLTEKQKLKLEEIYAQVWNEQNKENV